MTAPTLGLPERLRRLAEYQNLPGIKTIMEDAAQELDTERSEKVLLNHKLAGEMRVANNLRQMLAEAQKRIAEMEQSNGRHSKRTEKNRNRRRRNF